jgi:hypothetical protein
MGLADNRGIITAGLILGTLSIVLAYVTYECSRALGCFNGEVEAPTKR